MTEQRVALIEAGTVRFIVWSDGTAPEGYEPVPCPAENGVEVGWGWDGTQFLPPPPPAPPPVPQTVSRQQIMAALMLAGLITEPEWLACYQDGTLPALVQAAIDTLPDAASKLVAKVKWVDFSEARRDDALMGLLQAQAGLSDTQLDDLFRTAATL